MGDGRKGEVEATATSRLLALLLGPLGLGAPLLVGAAACGTNPPTGEDDGGVTTDPSGGPTSADASGSGEGGSSDDGSDDGSDGDEGTDTGMVKLDVGPVLDVGGDPIECSGETYWSELEIPAEFAGCRLGPFDVPVIYQQLCVPAPESGDCSEICVDSWCLGLEPCVYSMVLGVCGEFEIAGECCVLVATEEPPPVGRPFVVAGEARLAQLDASATEDLSPAAAHWLACARGEHASIAAFARFVADLQRFAAPPELIAAALAAAGDEVRHTRVALALASRFAGRPLRLGPLAVVGAVTRERSLAAAVLDAVLEGCIDETLAAHEAACSAAHARDPEVAAALEQIAADEARHAALAWRFVAWAVREHPSLAAQVLDALDRGRARVLGEAARGRPAGDELLALGCPSPGLRSRWRRQGLRELVEPCAARLRVSSRGPGVETIGRAEHV